MEEVDSNQTRDVFPHDPQMSSRLISICPIHLKSETSASKETFRQQTAEISKDDKSEWINERSSSTTRHVKHKKLRC